MKLRSSVLLIAGLLVGGAIGYAVGRRSASEVAQVPAVAPAPERTPPAATPPAAVPPATAAVPADAFPVIEFYPSSSQMRPVGVTQGETKATALAMLSAAEFERWEDPGAAGPWERFRKQWGGGYHYVSLRFNGEEVAEVAECWNDP